MNSSKKKDDRTVSVNTSIQKRRSRTWRRIVSIALCVGMLSTNVGIAAAAEPTDPVLPQMEDSQYVENVSLGTDASADAATQETEQTEPTKEPEPDLVTEPETKQEAEETYTLHLTHYFRFTIDGKKVSVKETEEIQLTEADFEDGECDLNQFAYDKEQLKVTEAKPISIDNAIGNDIGARIVYAVNSGWRVVRAEQASEEGVSLRTVFNGGLGDYEFVPAKVVNLKIKYKYSNTGGLAGIDVADPDIVEAEPKLDVDSGNYVVEWKLPETPDGFRIVLNPAPLNEYLVSKPTGNETAEELEKALERGDFAVNVDNPDMPVYYYQEEPDETENPTYSNRYSTDYNKAWNAARKLTETGYTAEAYCTDNGHIHDEAIGHGANALTDPKLRVTLTEAQLKAAMEKGLDITVYYRRNATWYTVNHWVPKTLAGNDIGALETKTEDGVEYVRLDQETLQGRVGATTAAKAKTDEKYALVSPIGFSQKLIENTATVVDIYYAAADSYRVIFDTDYTYIPRQQVEMGKDVDFSEITKEPTRTGYTFDGWQYLKKGATPDADGNYADNQYVKLGKDNPQLKVDETLIANAKLQESGGVLALHLYPIWTPNKTNVRVILWTEDLVAGDDVQAIAEGGNSGNGSYYTEKYRNYSNEPKPHNPNLNTSNADYYSNAGSFTVSVDTDASLLKAGADRALLDQIQTQVTEQFKVKMGQASGIDVANFYTQAGFQIVHEGEGATAADYNATTASSDGKTTINVFFTRKIYQLKFHYYGEQGGNPYSVATNTNGYSWGGINAPGQVFPDGNLNFNYAGAGAGGTEKNNTWANTGVISPENMPVPQTITIKAKYGADLRDVWPAARAVEAVGNHRMISWATTRGKYCEDGQFGAASGSSHDGEPTIMGVYAAMGSEIIADPTNNGTPHHLVAYWWNDGEQSHYRYNHCYEVPDLNVTGMQRVSIHNNDITNAENFLYLVPTTNAIIQKYGFDDLMKVSYDEATQQITYGDDNGDYYAVRAYPTNGETKYYAVARQVETVSTNAINKQNPSARLHMTRVNPNADHSTQYRDGDGGGNPYIGADKPYDLYFYYNRDRYTITYMVPSNNITTGTEVTLGTIELPYGTLVTQADYGFALDYQDKNDIQVNGTNKYPWDTKNTSVAVCPDRAENGTAEWKFKGWALGPAGVNMQWANAQAQAGEDFALASNLRLYAIWETPTYDVTFHLDGGSVNNSTENIVENVPANRRYSSTEATIPRPLRNGYVFTGWFKADENGNITDPKTAFDFDKEVTSNLHVAADWSPVSTETFNYNVYYVTDKPLEADKNNDTVQIDASGNIVTTGGTTYYVLGKDVKTNQMYVDNMALNLTAAKQDGYVPRDKNQILTPDAPNEDYDVIFMYDPIITDSHTVRFVLAGTEDNTQYVVKDFAVKADQTVVTPKSEFATALKNMGYALVNKDADADTYTTVDKAEDLKWIDKDGNAQEMATLTGGANIPDTITYLVQPIPYTITYENAADAPTGAEAALQAVTADASTPVGNAKGKNPTQYTTIDTFTAKNPAPVYADGKWYVFSHWSLKDGTTATGDDETTEKFTILKVDQGTVGNLVFVANWRVSDGTGSLTVSKTVVGNAGETNKDFHFTVTLSDKTISGTFGTMEFTNGVAAFTLKHNESKTASNLPEGIGYEVTETEADQNGYTTTATGDKGTIAKDTPATAAFTNTKGSTGGGGSSSSGSKNKKPSKVDKVLNTADHFQYVQGYPDDTVGPERNITRAEATVIFFRLLNDSVRTEYLDATNEFPDVKLNDWFNLGISTMENGGFVSGYDDGLFRPNGYITRAELATIISNFDDLEPATENKFADVDGHWAERYINSSAEKGWLSGYEDGLFRPNQYITRAETMSMINRVLDRKVDAEGLHKDAKQWIDNPEYKWYYYTVLEATNHHEYEREDASDFENWTEIKPDKIWEN